ncbi:MAG: hypothetical protein ACI9T7_003524 [Oleiphilaceae bacterium]|jgi:hypothetical protein
MEHLRMKQNEKKRYSPLRNNSEHNSKFNRHDVYVYKFFKFDSYVPKVDL